MGGRLPRMGRAAAPAGGILQGVPRGGECAARDRGSGALLPAVGPEVLCRPSFYRLTAQLPTTTAPQAKKASRAKEDEAVSVAEGSALKQSARSSTNHPQPCARPALNHHPPQTPLFPNVNRSPLARFRSRQQQTRAATQAP